MSQKVPTILDPYGRPLHNGLMSEAVMGAAALQSQMGVGGGIIPWGYPGTQGSPWTAQLSQPNTVFRNLRWYLISNMRQMLNEIYAEIGLVQTIVDVPIDDALRGGVTIKSKQLEEEQIDELKAHMDREQDLVTAGEAGKWNRLFGGAGVVLINDQDPMDPFDISDIGPDDKIDFKAADLWELFYDKQNAEGYLPIIDGEEFEFYDYYGEKVHKSRVMPLRGINPPSFIRPRLRGWGLSVAETLVRSINQYLKSSDLLFEVLDEFKVDVFRMKGLVQTLMNPGAAQKVAERIALANFQKNYQNALTIDSEDEWDHKQLSFTGIAEAMREIRMQVASDMRMPLSKLFGISASGFNSGEDDIEVYNAMVESQVRNKLKYPILHITEIRCQQLFGFVPTDLQMEFQPLRVLSAEQEEACKTQVFQRAMQARQIGEIDSKIFKEICNKENLLGGVMLDTNVDADAEQGDFESDSATDEDGGDEAVNEKDPAAANITVKVSAGSRRNNAKDPPNGQPKKTARPVMANSLGAEQDMTALSEIVPYTRRQKFYRLATNSVDFDKASFVADGGVEQMQMDKRGYFFDRDKAKDHGLWDRAIAQAIRAGYRDLIEQKAFAVWWYRKNGGTF